MRHERHCQMCGEVYQYCPNCSDYDDQPRWRALFDSENCLKIYEVCNEYKAGIVDAKAAKARLEKLDMSKKNNFEKGFKKIVSDIYAKAGSNNAPVSMQRNNNIVK